MAKVWTILAALAPLLAACVDTQRSGQAVITMPAPGEAEQFVRDHWTKIYASAFAQAASRPLQERSTLTDVRTMQCARASFSTAVADCTFEATASFADGQSSTHRLHSEFERDRQGRLSWVFYVLQPRPS
jgi:hypothetical protein